jgi:hypothetical protein
VVKGEKTAKEHGPLLCPRVLNKRTVHLPQKQVLLNIHRRRTVPFDKMEMTITRVLNKYAVVVCSAALCIRQVDIQRRRSINLRRSSFEGSKVFWEHDPNVARVIALKVDEIGRAHV